MILSGKADVLYMKDLQIKYRNENGKIIKREYGTIMDFIDEMESDNIDIPRLDYEVVSYIFFENRLNSGYGGTIENLLTHCKEIVQ